MCDTRKWSSIVATEAGANSVRILAKRSDGVHFFLIRHCVDVEKETLSSQFCSLLNYIESFRNCFCQQNTPCEQHSGKIKETKEN